MKIELTQEDIESIVDEWVNVNLLREGQTTTMRLNYDMENGRVDAYGIIEEDKQA